MDFDAYQALAKQTLNPALDAPARLLDAAAGLSEEAGEVLGAIRKHLFQGQELRRDDVRKELGDVLWCLAAVATSLDLSLGDVAHTNLQKLRQRYPHGFSPDAARERADDAPETGR